MPMRVRWWKGAEVSRAVDEAAEYALGRAAEHVLTQANDRVPHDEGTLMRSGSTDVDGRAGIASISYDTPYAVRLHENPQYNFQSGREGKWLERTMNDEARAIEGILADGTKRAF